MLRFSFRCLRPHLRTSFHHQPKAQHPKYSAIHKNAGRLPHLLTQSGHVRPRLHSGARACRSGSLEIIIKPENGLLSSNIRKIAHDAESAKSDRQVKTVTFKSENRLKLANMMTIQSTKMTRNGVGITLLDSAKRTRRVCTKSVLTCAARF